MKGALGMLRRLTVELRQPRCSRLVFYRKIVE